MLAKTARSDQLIPRPIGPVRLGSARLGSVKTICRCRRAVWWTEITSPTYFLLNPLLALQLLKRFLIRAYVHTEEKVYSVALFGQCTGYQLDGTTTRYAPNNQTRVRALHLLVQSTCAPTANNRSIYTFFTLCFRTMSFYFSI